MFTFALRQGRGWGRAEFSFRGPNRKGLSECLGDGRRGLQTSAKELVALGAGKTEAEGKRSSAESPSGGPGVIAQGLLWMWGRPSLASYLLPCRGRCLRGRSSNISMTAPTHELNFTCITEEQRKSNGRVTEE